MNRGASAVIAILAVAAVVSIPLLERFRLLPPGTNDAGYLLSWFAVIGAAAVGARVIRGRVRKSAYETAAEVLGFRSVGGTDQFWRYPLPLFDWGWEKSIGNMMVGAQGGQDITVLDYSCKSSPGRGSTFRYLCALVDMSPECPKTEVAPHTLATRTADIVGVERVDLEYESFSRRYRVQSSNRKFAVALIDPPMIEWLLTQRASTHFELGGAWVMSVGANVDMQDARSLAAETARLLSTALDFRGRIPHGAMEIAQEHNLTS
jgi:hypothetical protein